MNKTSVIILAAGKGTRMKSKLPKVLHEIAGKPIIIHVIDACKKLKLDNIYVVLNENSKNIKKILPKKTKIIIQKKQLGTANALMATKTELEKYTGNLLVLYGDVPFIKATTLKKLLRQSKNTLNLLGFYADNPKGYGRIIKKNNKIFRVIEEKDADAKIRKIDFCNSGIFCSPGKVLFNLLKKIVISKSSKEFLLTDIFQLAYEKQLAGNVITVDEEEVIGINDKYQLAIAESKYQNLLRKNFLEKGVTIVSPETVIFSHDTKISSDVFIGAFCFFGKKVIIKKGVKIDNNCSIEETTVNEDSSLGPFCRLRNANFIGKRVKIGNFVELKNSYIGNNTKISHLAYIGDATIGTNTNIGAGTITCNYDGKKKNNTKIGNDVFIGSNCSLIAPINIANNCFVAAGSTISKNLLNEDFSIARARQQIVRKGRNKFLKS